MAGKRMSGYGAKPQSARKAAAAGARSAGSYNRGKVRSRSVVSAAESHNSTGMPPRRSWSKFGEGDGSREYAYLKENYKDGRVIGRPTVRRIAISLILRFR